MTPAPDDTILGPQYKSIPPEAWGKSISEFVAARPRLSSISTPVLTIDQRRLTNNIAAMAQWTRAHSMLLAPHGKTTMAPQLWQRQLDCGAWGITLATVWQAQLARRFGINRIVLANELISKSGLHWVAGELDTHPEFEFYCWADSLATVELMEAALSTLGIDTAGIRVVVELGATSGRTGARSKSAALAVATKVAESPLLTLAGVGGYEGVLGHDRSAEAVDRVNTYLRHLTELYHDVTRVFDTNQILSVGGSAYPDLVATQTRNAIAAGAQVVLRSGAYLTHDDGFYEGISPFSVHAAASDSVQLTSAIHGWARVVSVPEADLALLDAGKRDLPYDEGLPSVQTGPRGPVNGTVTAMNDQHTYVRSHDLNIGDVVRLGLSHPCTAFDKWRLIPVINDVDAPDPVVVDFIHTYF
ncbi:MAG: amino acid deaminase [Mycobacterium sp.]